MITYLQHTDPVLRECPAVIAVMRSAAHVQPTTPPRSGPLPVALWRRLTEPSWDPSVPTSCTASVRPTSPTTSHPRSRTVSIPLVTSLHRPNVRQRLGSHRRPQGVPGSSLPQERREHPRRVLQVSARLFGEFRPFSMPDQSPDIQFIEDNQDIVFYKNRAGMAQKYAVEEGGDVSDSGVDVAEFKDDE